MNRTVDDAAIRTMATDRKLTLVFPFFKTMRKKQETKACCGRKRIAEIPDYEAIRRAIVELPDDKKLRLKELYGLSAGDRLSVSIAKPDGTTNVYVF